MKENAPLNASRGNRFGIGFFRVLLHCGGFGAALRFSRVVAWFYARFDRTAFAAEVGLSGEVRPVSRIESRVGEAARLGFEKIFISKYDSRNLGHAKTGIQVVAVSVIEEAFRTLFA